MLLPAMPFPAVCASEGKLLRSAQNSRLGPNMYVMMLRVWRPVPGPRPALVGAAWVVLDSVWCLVSCPCPVLSCFVLSCALVPSMYQTNAPPPPPPPTTPTTLHNYQNLRPWSAVHPRASPLSFPRAKSIIDESSVRRLAGPE